MSIHLLLRLLRLLQLPLPRVILLAVPVNSLAVLVNNSLLAVVLVILLVVLAVILVNSSLLVDFSLLFHLVVYFSVILQRKV